MKKLTPLLLAGILILITACNIPAEKPIDGTEPAVSSAETTAVPENSESIAVPEKIPAEYRDTLSGKSDFLFTTEDNVVFVNIRDFDFMNTDGGYTELYQFAVIDLDRDGDNELVLQIMSAAGDMGGYLVLNSEGNYVHGFRFDNRTFRDLKTDGTFSYSYAAGNEDGVAEIVYFEDGLYNIKKLLCATGEAFQYENFFVDEKQATEEEYNALLAEQEKKPDAVWEEYYDGAVVTPITFIEETERAE